MNFFDNMCADPENPTKKEIFAGLMLLAKTTKKSMDAETTPKDVNKPQGTMNETRKEMIATQEKVEENLKEEEKESNALQQEKLCDIRAVKDVPMKNVSAQPIVQQGSEYGEIFIGKRSFTTTTNNPKSPQTKTIHLEFTTYTKLQLGTGESARPLTIRDHLTGKSMDVYKDKYWVRYRQQEQNQKDEVVNL
jgi:hypothetical protein